MTNETQRPGADSDAGQIEGLIAKWSGCWCETQMAWDHDPRVRDCPQHGSDDCRHMAEGIVDDLRALIATTVTSPGDPEPPFCTVCRKEILYGSRCHDHPATRDTSPAVPKGASDE